MSGNCVPRHQIVQDQCRHISGAGRGRSDLVARRVARLQENATNLTRFAENFFVILFGHLSTLQKTNEKASQMAKSRTHKMTIVHKLSTRCLAESRENHFHRTKMPTSSSSPFFLTLQASVRLGQLTNTHSQSDKTDVTDTPLNINTKPNACQSFTRAAVLDIF